MKCSDLRTGDLIVNNTFWGHSGHLIISLEVKTRYKTKRPRDKKPRIDEQYVVIGLMKLWSSDLKEPQLSQTSRLIKSKVVCDRVYRDGERIDELF